jgi:hypothetical protein
LLAARLKPRLRRIETDQTIELAVATHSVAINRMNLCGLRCRPLQNLRMFPEIGDGPEHGDRCQNDEPLLHLITADEAVSPTAGTKGTPTVKIGSDNLCHLRSELRYHRL